MINDEELVHSGFVTVVGRPNVGKSTLVNRIVGTKVSIGSDEPQPTRMQVRCVLSRPDAQIVFVDTPGLHKPRTALGERTNASAVESIGGVDVVVFVLDATGPIARGDNFVSEMLPRSTLCVLNKIDGLSEEKVLTQLARAGEYEFDSYFPVSARTGRGVKTLVDHIVALMPPGPAHYPIDSPSDMDESVWVAELVREQLLRLTHDELPHSITTRVTEWEWPRIRVEILVERDSQKGIAIGKNGAMLKAVGSAVRQKLPPGAFLELHVKLEKDWQRRGNSLDRLGF